MSFEAERRVIESHFQERWSLEYAAPGNWTGYVNGVGDALTPKSDDAPQRVAFDNVLFNPPKPNLLRPELSCWVRLTVLPAGAAQITVGSAPIVQHNGVISVQIFHPINARANVMGRFADIVSRIFDFQTLTISAGVVVQCLRSSLVRVGPFNDWYQTNVNTVYLRQGQEGVASAEDRLIDYGILGDIADEGTWTEGARSPATFSSALSTRVVWPETTDDQDKFYFEPHSPKRFAFGAVYSTALEPVIGTYDWQWQPHNPGGDADRVVYVTSGKFSVGTIYVGTIHHLFEIA